MNEYELWCVSGINNLRWKMGVSWVKIEWIVWLSTGRERDGVWELEEVELEVFEGARD
jgi:hypothetical protein